MSAATIVDPTGVPKIIEINIPIIAQVIETIDEQITTDLKFLNMRIADKAGKIISADISNEPTRFIARTMIIAIMIAIIKLYTSTF